MASREAGRMVADPLSKNPISFKLTTKPSRRMDMVTSRRLISGSRAFWIASWASCNDCGSPALGKHTFHGIDDSFQIRVLVDIFDDLQGRSHFFPNVLWRSAERTHGDHDAQDGCDDSQPWQRFGHRGERRDGERGLMVVDVHVQFHHLVGVKWLDPAAGRHAQGIAHKMERVTIL